MRKSFALGLFAGIAAPLICAAATTAAVYHLTGRVPCPVRRTDEQELVIALVPPGEVRGHMRQWKSGFDPLVAVLRRLGQRTG